MKTFEVTRIVKQTFTIKAASKDVAREKLLGIGRPKGFSVFHIKSERIVQKRLS